MRLFAWLLLILACSTAARAQTKSNETDGAVLRDKRGDPASFRGRRNHATAGEVLAWVPRIVFSPITFVTDILIRRPIYAVLEWSDRRHVFPYLDEVFNPTPSFSWHPIAVFDIGVFYAGGAAFTASNLVARGHTLAMSLAAGGPDAYFVSASDTWRTGPFKEGLRARAFTRGDRVFYGFGPYSTGPRTNFTQARVEAFATESVDPGPHFHLDLAAGFRHEATSGTDDAPSIETRFQTSLIPGFGQTNLAMATADLRLDSRKNAVDEGGGVRFEANATYGSDVVDHERRFVRTEADLELAAEVSKPDRIVTLRGYFSDAVPLGSEPVPFLEQSMLGWRNHYGFIWGRYRDESAVLAELRYRYPIAYFIDMNWVASVGNVFSRDLHDFDPKALTASFGVGFRTRRTGRAPLQLVVAVGTSRFDEAFAIDSVRLYLSTTEEL